MKYKAQFAVAIMCGLLIGSTVLAQDKDTKKEADVIIINQDGERVDPGQLKKRIIRAQAEGESGGVAVSVKDGKITIVGKDGKKREIDLEGAQSIIINQSTQSVVEDGEKKTVNKGKAVIVGPDGKRHEIELDGALGLGDATNMFMFKEGFPDGVLGRLRKLPKPLAELQVPGAVWAESAKIGKFMIGVNCKPVPESLRAHLDLDQEAGLIVESLGDDSPAATAGLKRHDILMSAGDRQLASVEDLVDAVQKAGEAEKELPVTVIRAGKDLTVKITPVERPANQLGLRMRAGKPLDFEFQDLGPGTILDEGFGGMKDMELQMKRMQKQMQEMQEMMRQQMGPESKAMQEMLKKVMEQAAKDGDLQFDFDQKSDKDTDRQSNKSSDKT